MPYRFCGRGERQVGCRYPTVRAAPTTTLAPCYRVAANSLRSHVRPTGLPGAAGRQDGEVPSGCPNLERRGQDASGCVCPAHGGFRSQTTDGLFAARPRSAPSRGNFEVPVDRLTVGVGARCAVPVKLLPLEADASEAAPGVAASTGWLGLRSVWVSGAAGVARATVGSVQQFGCQGRQLRLMLVTGLAVV